MFGQLGPVAMLGLPGNPVSSLVCAILFLAPAIAVLLGLPPAPPPTVQARLGAAVAANDHRADHLRAALSGAADGALIATPFPRQDSAMLRTMAQADALVLRAPNAPSLMAGDWVDIIRLDAMAL